MYPSHLQLKLIWCCVEQGFWQNSLSWVPIYLSLGRLQNYIIITKPRIRPKQNFCWIILSAFFTHFHSRAKLVQNNKTWNILTIYNVFHSVVLSDFRSSHWSIEENSISQYFWPKEFIKIMTLSCHKTLTIEIARLQNSDLRRLSIFKTLI